MQFFHKPSAVSVSFDEANLVSSAGLLPVMTLASDAGLHDLADERLSVPTDKGANAGLKVASLVAGMVAGADSIDDMAVLRHGGMGRLFTSGYVPSTLGSFLRSFTFGHVRQLDAVASRFLANLGTRARLLGSPGVEDFVFVDVTVMILPVLFSTMTRIRLVPDPWVKTDVPWFPADLTPLRITCWMRA